MSTAEKESREALHLFKEIQAVRKTLSGSSLGIVEENWSCTFIQHPSNFPVVNYKRSFFWNLGTIGVAKLLFQLIFKKEWQEGDLNYHIKHHDGYVVLYC